MSRRRAKCIVCIAGTLSLLPNVCHLLEPMTNLGYSKKVAKESGDGEATDFQPMVIRDNVVAGKL